MEKYDLETLNRVWERVSNTANDVAPEEGACCDVTPVRILRELMREEAAAAAEYSTLAARLRNNRCAAAMLRRIAADERRHFQKLQSAYFMITGDTFSPEVKKPGKAPVIQSLRSMYLGELEAVKAYGRAAEEDPGRGDLYRNSAADEKWHSAMLKNLIERLFR